MRAPKSKLWRAACLLSALTKAGLNAYATEVSQADAGMTVDPKGVEIDHYPTAVTLAKAKRSFANIRKSNPGRIRYRFVGNYLFWIATEASQPLSAVRVPTIVHDRFATGSCHATQPDAPA